MCQPCAWFLPHPTATLVPKIESKEMKASAEDVRGIRLMRLKATSPRSAAEGETLKSKGMVFVWTCFTSTRIMPSMFGPFTPELLTNTAQDKP